MGFWIPAGLIEMPTGWKIILHVEDIDGIVRFA